MPMKALSLCILLAVSMPSPAQISVGIDLPGVGIGINLGTYPDLTPIPDYPVYYAPRTDANLFFYDGLYWVYSQDGWYSSAWYNGPWAALAVEAVPLFLLRVPVRYYRQPPMYFRHWRADAPPRWGERWGQDWEQRHHGWEHWDSRNTPRLAPLPVYQRGYDHERYPRGERQLELRREHYDYQPREESVRRVYQRPVPAAPQRAAGRERRDQDGGRPVDQQRAESRPQERQRQERGQRTIERSSEQMREVPARKAIKLEPPQMPAARAPRHEPSRPGVERPAQAAAPRAMQASPRGDAGQRSTSVRPARPAKVNVPERQPARQREQARPQQAAHVPAPAPQNPQQRERDNKNTKKHKDEQGGER